MTTQRIISKFSKVALLSRDRRTELTREEKIRIYQRIAAVTLIGIVALTSAILCILYGKPLWDFVSDTEKFRAWIESKGAAGPLLFLVLRTVQTVVKIVPSEPFEIGAGYAFGTWVGCFYCMLGTFLGSLIIIAIARKFGTKLVNLFVPQQKLESVRLLQQADKVNALLFIIYLIPATPKDVITYFVGVLPVRIPMFLLLTTIARFPSVISSTICGSALGDRNWWLVIGVYAATVVLGAVGMFFYKRWMAKKYPASREVGEKESA